jgi:predicted outer membrane protein
MTLKPMQFASVIALSLAGMAAQADCPFPKAPAAIPRGSTASEPEMLAAMEAFKRYKEEVRAFQVCLDEESKEKATSGGQTMQFKAMQAKKLAAAVEELESKAKTFNEQVRIYKAKAS